MYIYIYININLFTICILPNIRMLHYMVYVYIYRSNKLDGITRCSIFIQLLWCLYIYPQKPASKGVAQACKYQAPVAGVTLRISWYCLSLIEKSHFALGSRLRVVIILASTCRVSIKWEAQLARPASHIAWTWRLTEASCDSTNNHR